MILKNNEKSLPFLAILIKLSGWNPRINKYPNSSNSWRNVAKSPFLIEKCKISFYFAWQHKKKPYLKASVASRKFCNFSDGNKYSQFPKRILRCCGGGFCSAAIFEWNSKSRYTFYHLTAVKKGKCKCTSYNQLKVECIRIVKRNLKNILEILGHPKKHFRTFRRLREIFWIFWTPLKIILEFLGHPEK